MNLTTFDFSDINSEPGALDKLFEIFKLTLNPDLTSREFNQYIFGIHPESFEISFIYEEEELAGFCTAGAYPLKVNNKKIVAFRSAFGLLDKFKKGKFPLQGLFYKYMRYKLRHPFTRVYVTGFMANPLMYAMICKYTRVCYPRRNKQISVKTMEFKNHLLNAMRLSRKEINPFVIKIHFQVRFKESDVQRFETSEDEDVKYFLSINPLYNEKVGVLVLVPVTAANMIHTFLRYLMRKITRKFRGAIARSKIALEENNKGWINTNCAKPRR